MTSEAGIPAPGPLVARGRDADVYAAGDGEVLRRYRDRGRSAAAEARVMRHAAARGYPVPEVVDVDGGDLRMRRVDGPTMLTDLGRRPWRLLRHAATLADLHARLHRIEPPADLPMPFGPGRSLLHLDLHPDNVLLSTRGPVVIDWANAAAGPAAADEAQTWVILATSTIPATGGQRRLLEVGRRLLVRRLLAHLDRDRAAAMLPAVAAARRDDPNVLDEERAAIDRLLAAVVGDVRR